MINTKPIKETNKISPIDIQKKIELNPEREDTVKRIAPKFEMDKQNTGLSKEELEKAIEQSNRMIFKDDSRFEFKMHERTGRMMVKLIDNETDEVIKEIPPEKILDLVASIWDLVGILVDERG